MVVLNSHHVLTKIINFDEIKFINMFNVLGFYFGNIFYNNRLITCGFTFQFLNFTLVKTV